MNYRIINLKVFIISLVSLKEHEKQDRGRNVTYPKFFSSIDIHYQRAD